MHEVEKLRNGHCRVHFSIFLPHRLQAMAEECVVSLLLPCSTRIYYSVGSSLKQPAKTAIKELTGR